MVGRSDTSSRSIKREQPRNVSDSRINVPFDSRKQQESPCERYERAKVHQILVAVTDDDSPHRMYALCSGVEMPLEQND
jgi:hypothetical protein